MAAVVAALLACSPAAVAAEAPPMTVSVEQASGQTGNYFEVSAGPGERVRAGTLEIGNPTGRDVTVMLDPVRGTTASTLGSAYGLRGSKPGPIAGWISLSQRRVVLPPHGRVGVDVSVDVGAGAAAGEYLAGIGVQSADKAEVEANGNLAIASVQRYAVGLVVKVPGPRNPSIKMTGVGLDREPAGVTFKLRARNDGNVILRNVAGQATISSGGDVVARRKLGPGTFVTDSAISYPLLVPSLAPQTGTEFRVQAYLRYPGGIARISRVVEFGEIDAARQQAYGGPAAESEEGGSNLLAILLAAALLAGGGALAWKLRGRRPSAGESALQRALPREVARARGNREPLNLTVVRADGPTPPRDLVAAVRDCLRPRDQVFEVKGSGLTVVSPDTTPEAGQMLASEISRRLARGGGESPSVFLVTNAEGHEPDALWQAVSQSGNGAGQGSAATGNGSSEVSGGTEASSVSRDDGRHG